MKLLLKPIAKARPIFTFILLVGFLLPKQASATHVMGADITYKCKDSLKFEVILKYYRWCNGVSFTNPNLKVRCGTGNPINASLSLVSIKEITPLCKTAAKRCSPTNTKETGEGIEEHTYKAIIDFNTAPFSALANCCNIIFETDKCCRNSNITTGAANYWFYTFAELNLCKAPCNSSPALTTEPVAVLCCNQPFFYNMGALDIKDRDSLSYRWANPLSGPNTNIPYNGQLAYNQPFTAYYPGSLSFPYSNCAANPPIGISLDPVTGDICLTSPNCGEVTVAVVEVTEWRKNANGVYEKIGVTRRDMQFIVETCPDNNPPIVNGPFSYSVCEGSSLCFNITTNDITIPSQLGSPANIPDTVTISWNNAIPGATFTVINPTARLKTGQFCWTPSIGQASDIPYTFTVTARDDNCPRNALSIRSFNVLVKKRAVAERDIDTLDCGEYLIESFPSDGFKGTPTYRWQILDENLNILFSPKIAHFKSSMSFLSLNKKDTIRFNKGGTYIIQHNINNPPFNCESIYYDTLVVLPVLETSLAFGPDTFLCKETILTLSPSIENAQPPIAFQWSTLGVADNGLYINNAVSNIQDTLQKFDISLTNNQTDTAVSLTIRDASGCSAVDTVIVHLRNNPSNIIPVIPPICFGDSILIAFNYDTAHWVNTATNDTFTQGENLMKGWFQLGNTAPFSNSDSIFIGESGQYVHSIVDDYGCIDLDTFSVIVNDPVNAFAGFDQSVCLNDSFILLGLGMDSGNPLKKSTYTWTNITTMPNTIIGTQPSYQMLAKANSLFKLSLSVEENGLLCSDDDSTLIEVKKLPELSLCNDYNICCEYGNISLNLCAVPSGGKWSCKNDPQFCVNNEFLTSLACTNSGSKNRLVYSYVDSSTTCSNSDSILISINPKTEINLQEKEFCQAFDSINLNSELGAPSRFLGTPSWKCLECNGNDFNSMLVDNGNVGITDYWLKIDDSTYKVAGLEKDDVVLELSYINQFGCRSKDTVTIGIWKTPIIAFTKNQTLCWNDGKVNLDSLLGVSPNGGSWTCKEGSGFRTCSQLGGIIGGQIDTKKSIELPNPIPLTKNWIIQYEIEVAGCNAAKDTFLTILPRPDVSIADLDRFPPHYCETNSEITLSANPNGGQWSSNDLKALDDEILKPREAAILNDSIWVYYTYQNPNTNCFNSDSTYVIVEPQPLIEMPKDTSLCNSSQGYVDLAISVTGKNYSSLNWMATDFYGNRSDIQLADLPDNNVRINAENDKENTYRILAFASSYGACDNVEDYIDITIHPTPEFKIGLSDSSGCSPLTSSFSCILKNSISGTLEYLWSSPENSSLASPTFTFIQPGIHNVALQTTSEFGCETTEIDQVIVYPKPNALFKPSPDNKATISLPIFTFYNSSKVENILDASIVKNKWDFGVPALLDDTSNAVSPDYYYPNVVATYKVNLNVETNHGCLDDYAYQVEIGPTVTVYIPNAFSPNNDGPFENEGFTAIIANEKSMEMTIFNRWGEILFVTTDKHLKWDGTFQNSLCQQDAYAYVLKVIDFNDETHLYTGTVTLIR